MNVATESCIFSTDTSDFNNSMVYISKTTALTVPDIVLSYRPRLGQTDVWTLAMRREISGELDIARPNFPTQGKPNSHCQKWVSVKPYFCVCEYS